MTKQILAAMAFLCLVSGTAAADRSGVRVDVDKLKQLERQNSTPVQMSRIIVREGLFDTLENYDALIFEVTNTGEKPISGVSISFIGYDDRGLTANIDGSFARDSNGYQEIMTVSMEGAAIGPGETGTVSVAVNWEAFSGISASVSECRDADGNVYTNKDYVAWADCARGGRADQSDSVLLD